MPGVGQLAGGFPDTFRLPLDLDKISKRQPVNADQNILQRENLTAFLINLDTLKSNGCKDTMHIVEVIHDDFVFVINFEIPVPVRMGAFEGQMHMTVAAQTQQAVCAQQTSGMIVMCI